MKLKLLLLLFVIVVIEIELGLETEFLIQYLWLNNFFLVLTDTILIYFGIHLRWNRFISWVRKLKR